MNIKKTKSINECGFDKIVVTGDLWRCNDNDSFLKMETFWQFINWSNLDCVALLRQQICFRATKAYQSTIWSP